MGKVAEVHTDNWVKDISPKSEDTVEVTVRTLDGKTATFRVSRHTLLPKKDNLTAPKQDHADRP